MFIWAPLRKDDKNLSQYQAISMLDRQPRMLINILIFFLESNIYCLLSFLAKVINIVLMGKKTLIYLKC